LTLKVRFRHFLTTHVNLCESQIKSLFFFYWFFLLKSSPCWLTFAKLHPWGHTIINTCFKNGLCILKCVHSFTKWHWLEKVWSTCVANLAIHWQQNSPFSGCLGNFKSLKFVHNWKCFQCFAPFLLDTFFSHFSADRMIFRLTFAEKKMKKMSIKNCARQCYNYERTLLTCSSHIFTNPESKNFRLRSQ